jgi:hypothetical protein
LNLREGEMNRLFQRVNYLLISMAFLIAAVATVITNNNFVSNHTYQSFVYIIIGFGILLSCMFIKSHWDNNNNISRLSRSIRHFENKHHVETLTRFEDGIQDGQVNIPRTHKSWFSEKFELISPITIIIPGLFILFWVLSLCLAIFYICKIDFIRIFYNI